MKFLSAFALSAVLGMGLAGCGSASAPSNAATSASAQHSGHKKGHLKRRRVHGKVASVNSAAIAVVNKKGKTITFVLSSKTKYKIKKTPSTLSNVKTGMVVTVVGKTIQGRLTALLVRMP